MQLTTASAYRRPYTSADGICKLKWIRSAPLAGMTPMRRSIARAGRLITGIGSSRSCSSMYQNLRMAVARSWTSAARRFVRIRRSTSTNARWNALRQNTTVARYQRSKWNHSWSRIRRWRVSDARDRVWLDRSTASANDSVGRSRAIGESGFPAGVGHRVQVEAEGTVALPMSRYDIADYPRHRSRTVSRS